MEFGEALKERSGIDNSYLDYDTIDQLLKEMKSNMQNKSDLFNKHRIIEDVEMPIF